MGQGEGRSWDDSNSDMHMAAAEFGYQKPWLALDILVPRLSAQNGVRREPGNIRKKAVNCPPPPPCFLRREPGDEASTRWMGQFFPYTTLGDSFLAGKTVWGCKWLFPSQECRPLYVTTLYVC